MFIRFIVYSLAFYFIMKAVRIVIAYFKQSSSNGHPEVKQNRPPFKVDKKDIVEAEFEDITDKK